MFAPCPHCGYLMALIATADGAPRDCPRCHRRVDPHGAPPVRPVPPAAVPVQDVGPATTARGRMPDARTEAASTDAPMPAAETPGTETPSTDTPAAPGTDTRDARAVDTPVAFRVAPEGDAQQDHAPATAPPAPPARGALHSPSFARRRRAAPTRRSDWAWRAGALVLALLLGLQLLLSQQDTLAQDPVWRPRLARLCGVGLCTLPPGRDAAAFEMVERSVQPLPGTGALTVQARFRNAAPWPQAWPHLQLVLSDAQGHPAAARVFAPRDYAGAAARRAIAPGQTVQARLRVVEPQPATVAFAFDFR